MSFLDDYEPVEDRLREFWSQHPAGRIVTQIVQHGTAPGDVLLFLAECYRDQADEQPAASGWAHQRLLEAPPPGRNGPNTSAPEWTSPWEVAETSAIGRALANLGYAAKGKRPSREEVGKASGDPLDRPVPSPAGQTTPAGASATVSASPESSDDEAHNGVARTGTSPETIQEPGNPVTSGSGNVSPESPAPGAVTELGAAGAKQLADALGGQKFALDLARDQYGPDVTSLRKLTFAQGAELLEIARKKVPA